ncbi:MAG: GlsB/YeaQ/YmgE family stress response membrane protein, partial [Lachnospiraceae bacterium]|nr:GlsB/YeaQ/YmgE family stress response membrane protein [Lachnospiraceae bacterium]
IVGGAVGGFIFNLLGISIGGILGNIISGVVGACIVIFVVRLIKK